MLDASCKIHHRPVHVVIYNPHASEMYGLPYANIRIAGVYIKLSGEIKGVYV